MCSSQKNVWFVESNGQGRRIWKENRSLKELFLLQSAEDDWGYPVKMPHDGTDTPVPARPCTAGQPRASTVPLHAHPRLVTHPHAPATRDPLHLRTPNTLLGLPRQTGCLC